MGLSRLQGVLAQLYVDAELRERWHTDVVGLAKDFGLTAEETEQLAALSAWQVDFFAKSLKNKRLGQARKLLPSTAKVLGRSFAREFFAYAERPIPEGIDKHRLDTLRFVDFLGRRVNEGNDAVPAWVADLARYEAAWLELRKGRSVFEMRMFRYDLRKPLNEVGVTQDPSVPLRRRSMAFWICLPRGRVVHWLFPVQYTFF